MAHGHHKFGQIHKLHKQRNHQHEEYEVLNTKGKIVVFCKQPKCGYRRLG